MRPCFNVVLCSALLLSIVATNPAHAAIQEDESPVSANITLAGEYWEPDSETYHSFYGDGGQFHLRVGVGAVWFKKYIPVIHLETNLGLGYTTKKGFQVAADNQSEQTGDEVRLTIYPIVAEVLLGLDIFPEQILVPYGAIGFDVVPFLEVEQVENGSKLGGTKLGWHWRAGLAILLDPLEPARASQADAITGVNDVFLTLEAVRQNVPFTTPEEGAGFDFSGWSFRAGLKIVI